jgi:uncharacterized protein (TIGR03083 family)
MCPLQRDVVMHVNRLLTDILGWRVARVTCARALVALPGAHRSLRFVRPPALGPFLAFVNALRSADPDAPTRCTGWSVHELTAHVAAGSAELADLIELALSGFPSRPTRDFEVREAPYRALSPVGLRRAFFEEALRATVAVERLLNAKDVACVCFTGIIMDAQTLVLHIESELVLHRWDIVGNDATSIAALSDARFAVHAATTVSAMTPNVFPPRVGDQETIVLRASGTPDITVTGGATTSIDIARQDHSFPVVECHPAVSTLMLWGRLPGPGLPDPIGEPDAVENVVKMLQPVLSRQ